MLMLGLVLEVSTSPFNFGSSCVEVKNLCYFAKTFEISALLLKIQRFQSIIDLYYCSHLCTKERSVPMAVSYKRLWHLLIDRNMKKKDLQEKAKLTSYAMNKLSRDGAVTTDVLAKVCRSLNCTLDDIMEVLPESDTL